MPQHQHLVCPFNIGDIVCASSHDTYARTFKYGVVVHISDPTNDLGNFVYCDWRNPEALPNTYAYKFNNKKYKYIYGMYQHNLKLISSATLEVMKNLPEDPRLRGIAIKIRQMDERFKNRHSSKDYNNKERVLSDFQRSSLCT